MLSKTPKPRSRSIVVLLLSALALAAMLAFQAIASDLYHRTTAVQILNDYARAAAEESAQRIARDFEYYGFYPVFRTLDDLKVGVLGTALPAPEALPEGAAGYERAALAAVRYVFRFEFPSRTLANASALPSPLASWLEDTLPPHVTDVFDSEWRSAVLIRPGPNRGVFVYAVERDAAGDPVTAYGFELDADSASSLLGASVRREPLLPPSLLRGIDGDSLVVVRLLDAGGDVLYASHADSVPVATFAARADADARLGGISTHIALRPAAAEGLIHGGLPQARFRFIMGLLLLTAGLIAIALLQVRREHELARLRTEFVSNVSHELRTPLAQIRMFAETLLLGRVRSEHEKRRSLSIIDKEARRLTHLVENVLQFSRAERRIARVAPEQTALAPLIREAVDLFAPIAESSEIRFHTNIVNEVDAPVDRGAVKQMLLNLLDNAVKYGPAAQTVTVGLSLRDGMAHLWVEDQGPGIPEGDRERVWDRFARVDRERTAAVAGTGIGLSVVRELATLHGGRAWAETAPGGGARLTVELPNATPGHPTSQEQARSPIGPTPSQAAAGSGS